MDKLNNWFNMGAFQVHQTYYMVNEDEELEINGFSDVSEMANLAVIIIT